MPSANLLYASRFDGAGYPNFTTAWPDFYTLPTTTHTGATGATYNNPFPGPVCDGHGHGMGSYRYRLNWILKHSSVPASGNCKADLWGKWSNPGFSGGRSLGLCGRVKDKDNYVVARVESQATANPTLKLYKVIGGRETQLGSTWTGAALSATKLAAGIKVCRLRVEDLDDGNTRVSVYTTPLGASGDGDRRILFEGDLSVLRGNLPFGVELRGATNTEILVDDLEVYDFADEWTAPAPAPGSGWQVLIGDTLYDVDDSTGALEDFSPPVTFLGCGQEVGPGRATAKFQVGGRFTGGALWPGRRVICYHDGQVRFNGYMGKGSRKGAVGAEGQTWVARDAMWYATKVEIVEDDGSNTRTYNVFDPNDENYRSDRQGMTLGAVLKDLFDDRVDVVEGLRYHGCAPADVNVLPYVQSDLNLLDAEIPDIAVSGNFLEAVVGLLTQYMPNYGIRMEQDSKVWRFVKQTELTADEFTLTAEHAEMTVAPDPDRCITAVKVRGARKGRQTGVWLDVSSAMRNAWSSDMEAVGDKRKRNKRWISLTILAAGNAPFPPTSPDQPPTALVYVDVAAGSIDVNDFRGAVASVTGDAYPRWCVGHSSTRIWLSSPLWGGGTPPAPGEHIVLSLVDESAIPALSAAGVGRAFIVRPAVICAGYAPSGLVGRAAGDIFQGGACLQGRVSVLDERGARTYEDYAVSVHNMSAAQSNAFGSCSPIVSLNEKPKPSVGLINRLPAPGGSPPVDCQGPGADGIDPGLQIEVKVEETDSEVRVLRLPTNDGEWRGPAFSEDETLWDGGGEADVEGGDWGVRELSVIPMENFVDASQEAGILKAMAAILDLFSQKAYQFQITYATPWVNQGLRAGVGTSRFANLLSAVYVSSAKRTTGFEPASITRPFPVYSVWWDVPGRKTVIQAGTASAWMGVTPQAFVKQFTAKQAAIMMARTVKGLEDYRNCQAGKAGFNPVGTTSRGGVSGCEVNVIDQLTKRVVNVTDDDEDKKGAINNQAVGAFARELLELGEREDFPGEDQSLVWDPTDTALGAASQFPRLGAGPVLGPARTPTIPFQGPSVTPKSRAGQGGQYGGIHGSQPPAGGASRSFQPPVLCFKRGGLAFRGTPDAGGSTKAPTGLQAAALDASGDPGAWQDVRTTDDLRALLGAGKGLRSLAREGSLIGEIYRSLDRIERELNLVKADSRDRTEQPGMKTAAYPDGTPASIRQMITSSVLSQGLFTAIPSTWSDPGGVVFMGPVSPHGAGAVANPSGSYTGPWYWRVHPRHGFLARSIPALGGPGSGTNGGDWDWDTSGPGNTTEYIERAAVVTFHKQSEAEDVSAFYGGPSGQAAPYIAADLTHPFQVHGSRWVLMPGSIIPGTPAAMAWTFALPDRVWGVTAVHVAAREDPTGAWGPAGLTAQFQVDTVWSQSPWGGVNIAGMGSVTSDGAGTGTGQFRGPADAVPPGLRTPWGPSMTVAVSLPFGVIPPGTHMLIEGCTIECVVVDGGWAVLVDEPDIGVSETTVLNDSWVLEGVQVGELLEMDVEKVLAEAVAVDESHRVELNPPADLYESVECVDAIGVDLATLSEAVAVADSVKFEIEST